eukprot:2152233-Prymnesium_polylepis.1
MGHPRAQAAMGRLACDEAEREAWLLRAAAQGEQQAVTDLAARYVRAGRAADLGRLIGARCRRALHVSSKRTWG